MESRSGGCGNLRGEATRLERKHDDRAEWCRKSDGKGAWRHTSGKARREERQDGSEFRREIGVASWGSTSAWGQRLDQDEPANTAEGTGTLR